MKQNWPLDISVSFDPYYGEPARDGDQGAEVLPDGRVHFRIIAKDAHTVEIDRFGEKYPLTKTGEGIWEGTFDLGRGFLYFFLKIYHLYQNILEILGSYHLHNNHQILHYPKVSIQA